jgi:short subunit fatty acids transporter
MGQVVVTLFLLLIILWVSYYLIQWGRKTVKVDEIDERILQEEAKRLATRKKKAWNKKKRNRKGS